jgi:hypothetical protein
VSTVTELRLCVKEVGMAVNYFLRRRNEELQWAAAASCEAERQAHTTLAKRFEEAAVKVTPQTGKPRG